MTVPGQGDRTTGGIRDPRRARLVGLLLLGIAAVLLVSSVTWFAGGQTVVGIVQVAAGLLDGAIGLVLVRRGRAG